MSETPTCERNAASRRSHAQKTTRRSGPKREYCHRCKSRQTFVFDHGKDMFVCTVCEA